MQWQRAEACAQTTSVIAANDQVIDAARLKTKETAPTTRASSGIATEKLLELRATHLACRAKEWADVTEKGATRSDPPPRCPEFAAHRINDPNLYIKMQGVMRPQDKLEVTIWAQST